MWHRWDDGQRDPDLSTEGAAQRSGTGTRPEMVRLGQRSYLRHVRYASRTSLHPPLMSLAAATSMTSPCPRLRLSRRRQFDSGRTPPSITSRTASRRHTSPKSLSSLRRPE